MTAQVSRSISGYWMISNHRGVACFDPDGNLVFPDWNKRLLNDRYTVAKYPSREEAEIDLAQYALEKVV